MNAEVDRFFREAQAMSSLPPAHWIVPEEVPTPSLEIRGESQEDIRKKLVDIANSLLVIANRRAGEYFWVFYSFKAIKGRKRDPETGRMMSRAMVALAVLEKEKEKLQDY